MKKSKSIAKAILLCVFLAVFSSNASAQKVTLSFQNETFEKVLSAIKKQTSLSLVFSEQLVDLNRKVSINVNSVEVKDALKELLTGTNISFEIKNNKLYLVEKKTDESQSSSIKFENVSGTVADQNGVPIIGATVIEKGTKKGTITDVNGKFALETVSSTATLVISYIGYLSKSIGVGNKNKIDVILSEDNKLLDEVVVTGYGSVSRKNLTTSISKVKPDDIQKAASSNVTQLMVGRAAGLQATVASAQPGGAVNMSIRGGGTPLYVIDGVAMPSSSQESASGGTTTVIPNNVNRGGLAGLNPQDIESVEILKDAAAAIYGIGAGNGVILITTKRGKEGKVKVSYDGNYSVVNNYKYLQPLNAQEYMGIVNVFNKENYLYSKSMAPYGTTAYDNKWTQVYSDQDIANAKTTNWRDQVLKSGSISNHNIIINGGTKQLNYYLSGNYFNQEGTVSNSSMKRYAFRGSINSQVNSFIKLSATFNTNDNGYNNGSVGGSSSGRSNQAAGALTAAMAYAPNLPIYDANGNYSLFLVIPNPVAMKNIEDVTASNGTTVNFVADIDIIKNMLTAKLLYGYNREGSRRSVYIPTDVYFDQMYKSRGNLALDNRKNQTMEATVSYTNRFGEWLDFNAVLGMGKYLENTDGMNLAYDKTYDAIANDNLSAASGTFTPGSYRTSNEKRSQFGRANFDILDRYVVSATFRRDGTDKFFPGKKYAMFPSGSIAWKLSNEQFMKSITAINLLKIRASYGETGTDNLGSSLYGSYKAFGNQVMFGNNISKYTSVIQSNKDYPDVTWQKTTMKNIGLDYSLFKDKISGSFDIYSNDITNMLSSANTAGISMYGTYPINGGHVRRYGWDATLNTKNVSGKSFTWNSVLTLSRYNAIWIEREPNYSYAAYQTQKNEPLNALYYYRTNGVINVDKSNMPVSQPTWAQKPGYPVIVDKNGDGQISVADVDMVNAVPKLYLGFGNTFTYKNFDLDIFLYSQLGVKKYNYAYSWNTGASIANQSFNGNIYAFEMWNSQTNTSGIKPGIAWDLASQALPGGAGTDMGYEDASFIRVRNITLGYNLTSSNMGILGKYISNLRVYVDAQNPFLVTSFKGFDPEVYTGGDYKSGKAEYPQTRTFSVGIKATF
jgi:TonB-linked SusC/RagA family outer membrane protein